MFHQIGERYFDRQLKVPFSVMNFMFEDIIERERPVLREEIGKVLYPGGAGAGAAAGNEDDESE